MRIRLRAAVLAVLIALPFAVAAPQASADEPPKGGLQIDVPGLVHVCVRINNLCGS